MRYSNQVDGCQIWHGYEGFGSRAPDGTVYVEHSPRAGGNYAIARQVAWQIKDFGLDDSHKARLTTMLIDQRERGTEWPEVTSALIESAKSQSPLPVHERANRLLRYIASQMGTVNTVVTISQDTHQAYAWSESADWDEVFYLFEYLIRMNWVQGNATFGHLVCGLTVEGHSRIAEQRTNVDSSQAFVAMWFDDSMNAAYAEGVELGVRDAGYEPLRIDQKEHINKIDDEIIAEIRRSRFLVVDFTHGEDGARGGVYYEAGFAHGLGLQVIFTCREDSLDTLHFDTSHYSHIVWTDSTDLREKLKKRILAVIGEGPGSAARP